MGDKYDDAVEYLTEHPEKIRSAWSNPYAVRDSEAAKAHCLFQYCTPSGLEEMNPEGRPCGCLSMIAGDDILVAWTPELTKAIRADTRIPNALPNETWVEHLPVFAEWQRRLDKEIRTPESEASNG